MDNCIHVPPSVEIIGQIGFDDDGGINNSVVSKEEEKWCDDHGLLFLLIFVCKFIQISFQLVVKIDFRMENVFCFRMMRDNSVEDRESTYAAI